MFKKELIKEIIKNFLESERGFYEFLDESTNRNDFKTEIETIKRLEKHIEEGNYDIQLEAITNFITNEFLAESEKVSEKEKKQKGRKKSEWVFIY